MALKDTDLLPLYRITDKSNRKISVASFQSSLMSDGDDENYSLIWNGNDWIAGTVNGEVY